MINGSPNSAADTAVAAVRRTKKARRYRLLSNDQLKVPNTFRKQQYEYTKHLPLIPMDGDEDEDSDPIDSRLFDPVSNRSLAQLLQRDRSKSYRPLRHDDNDAYDAGEDEDDDFLPGKLATEKEEDQWDLSFSLPQATPSKSWSAVLCPCASKCTIS